MKFFKDLMPNLQISKCPVLSRKEFDNVEFLFGSMREKGYTKFQANFLGERNVRSLEHLCIISNRNS